MHKIQLLLTRDLTRDQFWFYIEIITDLYIRLWLIKQDRLADLKKFDCGSVLSLAGQGHYFMETLPHHTETTIRIGAQYTLCLPELTAPSVINALVETAKALHFEVSVDQQHYALGESKPVTQ